MYPDDDEHGNLVSTSANELVTVICGLCQKTGSASFTETDPLELAEERLFAQSCSPPRKI